MRFENILVVYSEKISAGHTAAVRRVRELVRACRRRKVRRSEHLRRVDFDGVDLVITIGGDGAFIRAARFIRDGLILGVNSEPEFSEGALTSVTDDQLDRLAEILRGRFAVRLRERARVTRNGALLPEPVLNEVYIGARYQFQTSRYAVEYRGALEEQRSSGVLVVTGSGSRAWFQAIGGRPFPCEARRLAFIVREPYRGRVFRARIMSGEIVPPETVAFQSSRDRGGVIALDANTVYDFNRGDRVEIGFADCPLRVAAPADGPQPGPGGAGSRK